MMEDKEEKIYDALRLRPGNKIFYKNCKYTVKNVIPLWRLDERGERIYSNILDAFSTIDFFFETSFKEHEEKIRNILLYAGFKKVFDVEIFLERENVLVCYASHDDIIKEI